MPRFQPDADGLAAEWSRTHQGYVVSAALFATGVTRYSEALCRPSRRHGGSCWD
jgi:hypothetical protein